MEPVDRAEHPEEPRRMGEAPAAPAIARVRDDDLEPHQGLRYIARLFKALAILLSLLLVAEVIGSVYRGVYLTFGRNNPDRVTSCVMIAPDRTSNSIS